MPESLEIAAVCGILFVAAAVRSTIGFGEAVIAMPLLALVMPLRVAAPLMALVATVNGVAILYRERRYISFRAVIRLIIPAIVTIPAGVFVLQRGDERVVKALLAILLFAYAIWSLRRTNRFVLHDDRWAPLAGLIGGLLGGAYNTPGPPVVVYGTLRRWPPERFRAMLQSYFMFGSVWILTMHAANGLVTQRVLTMFVASLPFLAAAFVLGTFLGRKLPAGRFLIAVHVALIAISLLLLASAITS